MVRCFVCRAIREEKYWGPCTARGSLTSESVPQESVTTTPKTSAADCSRPGFGIHGQTFFDDHKLPWSWDYEPDESLTESDSEDDQIARAYSCEPVIRDADRHIVIDCGDMEHLGPYGRILFAEWMVAKANAEAPLLSKEVTP